VTTDVAEGWYGPPASRRYHWFGVDGRSLCGKWFVRAWRGELVDVAVGPAQGDCAACSRELAARGGASS
jgi:hypothetical protein